MPLRRYRDVAEMPVPQRSTSALEGLAAACAAWSLSRAFGTLRQAPRGVRRFRSVEEADALQRCEPAHLVMPACTKSDASFRLGRSPEGQWDRRVA